MNVIQLYTTAGCHLCEQAQQLLTRAAHSYSITVQPVEIGDNDALTAEFGVHIPVLIFADESRLYWPFTQADIERHLDPG